MPSKGMGVTSNGVTLEQRPSSLGHFLSNQPSNIHVKKSRNAMGSKAQKSQLILNGKPFLMTVGPEEIKVLDAN